MSIEQFPYQAAIYNRNFLYCGGSIIHQNYILSAAHCFSDSHRIFMDKKVLSIGVGSAIRGGHFPRFNVKDLVIHPKFVQNINDEYYMRFDAAIVTLAQSLTFSNAVKPIALPAIGSNMSGVRRLVISGWGKTESGDFSNHLQSLMLPLVDKETCQKAFKALSVRIHETMFCAGHAHVPNKDACQGDSGGPVVANNVLYGIVSFGAKCGDPDLFGVYTNVTSIRSWIQRETGV